MKRSTLINLSPLGDSFANVQYVGSSAMGKTYVASRADQTYSVILKEVDLSDLSPDQIELFEEYIAAMRRITCPYIIHYNAIHKGDTVGKSYLELECFSLNSIQDTIDNHRANGKFILENFIWRVAATMVFTLEDLHANLAPQYFSEKSYRCLRPSNILVTEEKTLKVDDFGVTRLPGKYSSKALQPYIAPELLSGTFNASYADSWSVGCILLAMCTLTEPMAVIQQRASDGSLDLSKLHGMENYSHELMDLIEGCLYVSIDMRSTISQLRSHPRIWSIIATELQGSQRDAGSFLVSPRQSTFNSSSQQSLPILYSPPPLFSQIPDMQPPGLNMHPTHSQDQGIIQNFSSPHNLQSIPISTPITMPMPMQIPMPMQVPLQVPKLGSIDDIGAPNSVDSDVFNQIHQICNQMATMIYTSVQKAYSQRNVESPPSPPQSAVSLLPESKPEGVINSDETALMIAVRDRNMPMLLSNMSQLKNRRADNTTALMIAAEIGNDEALCYLLGEYRLQRKDGKTALMIAIIHKQVGVAKVLADFESKMQDKAGRTALMYACENGMLELIDILINSESGFTDANGYSALMIALQTNNIEGVRALVSREAMIALPDGTSPLIIAENLENKDLLELVKKHINIKPNSESRVHANEDSQSTPVEETRMKITVYDPPLECMRGAGQNKNNEGTTNLMEAARTGSVYGVKQYIYEKKQTDSKGWTALMKAAFYGKSECIPFLKEEMRMSNNAKYTALMSAAGNGHSSCVRLLLNEAKMRNWKGETALMIAIMNEQSECIKLLMEKEGTTRTLDGLTMLDYAIKHNKTSSVEVIKAHMNS